ncbi:MAG: hypothetical protein ACR2ML_15105 [Solirubrobacteraceae bacterium]
MLDGDGCCAEREGEEISLGLGEFWRPVLNYAAVDRERFRESREARAN